MGIFANDPQGVALAASVLLADWRPARPAGRPVLGVPEGPYLDQAGEEAQRQFRAAVEYLRGKGYTVLSVPALPDFEAIRARHNRIVDADAAQVHAEWFDRYPALYRPRTVRLIERGRAVSPEQLAADLMGLTHLRAELLGLMDAHSLDLWVAPSAPGPAPAGLSSTGDPVMNLPWTHSGLPALNLPHGQAANGLPLGLQFVGRWQADERLLAWAETLTADLAGGR